METERWEKAKKRRRRSWRGTIPRRTSHPLVFMSFMTLTKWIDCSIYWLLLRKKKKKNTKGWNSIKVFGRITHPRAGYFYCHLTSFRLFFFEFRLTPCLLVVVLSLSTLSSSRHSFALPKWRIATRAIYPQKGKSGGREREKRRAAIKLEIKEAQKERCVARGWRLGWKWEKGSWRVTKISQVSYINVASSVGGRGKK